jgi:GNAT superfamily N-acetyltransferase
MPYESLDSRDYDESLAFLLQRPELNVVLINNMTRFGMEPGDGPFNADYLGMRRPSGLEAVAAIYNLGSFFFYASGPEAVSGMAEHLVELGRLPVYAAGNRSHVEIFLRELGERGPGESKVIESRYMVLRGEVRPSEPAGRARAATPDDLEVLVSMGVDFGREAFGRNVMARDVLAQMLTYQVTEGAAVVVEDGGRIVSKAEATAARPHSALVGGVYTLPEARGRGFSTTCIAALCEGLLTQVGAVGLNVFDGNAPALAVYRKTGFEVVEEWLTVEMA